MAGKRGRFITFEGIEGSGKSTQAARLAEDLRKQGEDVVLTKEPGGTPDAEKIRGILLDPGANLNPRAELMLCFAARALHVEQIIRPALEAGRTVLCDRYGDSTIAYQGFGRGLVDGMGVDFLWDIHSAATGGLRPDLTLLFDLPVEVGLARAKKRGVMNRIDAEEMEFHRRVRDGYLWLAKSDGSYDRFVVIDASGPVEHVGESVRKAVMPLKTMSGGKIPKSKIPVPTRGIPNLLKGRPFNIKIF